MSHVDVVCGVLGRIPLSTFIASSPVFAVEAHTSLKDALNVLKTKDVTGAPVYVDDDLTPTVRAVPVTSPTPPPDCQSIIGHSGHRRRALCDWSGGGGWLQLSVPGRVILCPRCQSDVAACVLRGPFSGFHGRCRAKLPLATVTVARWVCGVVVGIGLVRPVHVTCTTPRTSIL